MTRLALGSPEMGAGVAATNGPAIAAGLRHFLLVAAERGAMGAGRALSRADAAGDAV